MEQVVSFKCKNCGFELTKANEANLYYCEVCGSKFQIESENESDDGFVIVAGILEKYTGRSTCVQIPDTVTVIGADCFRSIETLSSIILPKTLTKIGDRAFYDCTSLKKIQFPDSLTEIGDEAFKDTSIEEIVIPESVSKLGKDAFMLCSRLTKVVLPKNTQLNYERTFKQCYALENVDCNIDHFCLCVLKNSLEAKKNGDSRPTLFDAFQATPFLNKLKDQISQKKCLRCNCNIKSKGICETCGARHVDLEAGCYIATAVYESYDCPQVWTLRRFRDYVLANNWIGRWFIKLYYMISPFLVRHFGHRTWFKAIWKRSLDRMIEHLQNKGFQDSPYIDPLPEEFQEQNDSASA